MKKQWLREKDNLINKFDSIVQKKGKKKKGQTSNCQFYDASKSQIFTEVTGVTVDNSAVDNSVSASTISTSDNVPEPENVASTSPVSNKPRKSHNDQTLTVCISCLKRSNEKRPKKVYESDFLTNHFSAYYPDFVKDIEYLPKIICQCCLGKISSSSEPNVDYKSLVENVKLSQCFDSNSTESKNACEVCMVASASIIPFQSSFVLNSKSNPGRPAILPKQKIQPKITDFYKFTKKDMSENEKINHIINTVFTTVKSSFDIRLTISI